MPDLKPCQFCHEDREGYFKMIGAFFISNPFHRGEYYMNGGKMKPRKIKFCPMCGRSLCAGEEDKHYICGATNLPCIRCNPGGCDNRKEGADNG